jgi:hypothetical protein
MACFIAEPNCARLDTFEADYFSHFASAALRKGFHGPQQR